MKRLLLLSLFLFSTSLFAQPAINFETVGNSWNWTLFSAGTGGSFDVVANPSIGGLNTSDSCAKIVVGINGDPWAGVFSADFPDLTLTSGNCIVKILVYKDVISNFNLKLEPPNLDHNVPNTLMNQWEELTFDYSSHIGTICTTLTIIPDFSSGPPRPWASVNYFDNIRFTAIVPVELTSFTGAFVGKAVQLNWSTATELNNRVFEIQKSINNSPFVSVAFVDGKGTTTQQNQYSYIDRNIESRINYSYRLKQIDFDGSYAYSDVVTLGEAIPVSLELDQNYPNPFNPSTTISFALPVKSDVTLDVYNLVGQKILNIVNGSLEEGTHKYNFDASDLASGIYVYTLSAAGENGSSSVITKKMTLLK